jgi:hypothetical protein
LLENIYTEDTERRPVDGGDDDARGFPFPASLLFPRSLPSTASGRPKCLSLANVMAWILLPIFVDMPKLLEENIRKYPGRGSVTARGRYGGDRIMGFHFVTSVKKAIIFGRSFLHRL